jgi:hypothetical protein
MSEFGIIIYVDGDYRIRQMKSGFQVYKLDIPIGEKLQSLTGAIQFINERKEREKNVTTHRNRLSRGFTGDKLFSEIDESKRRI